MLTAYNGQSITYDTIGNPLTYRDGMSFTWNGRELAAATVNGQNISYSYNADGVRVKKTVGSTETYYAVDGGKVASQRVGGNSLYFDYSVDGTPFEVAYNSTFYYYVLNIQGDVIAICDSAGNPVVEYTYDPWGKVLSITGSLASTLGHDNPLRYRGYYYDNETGFYYLQSRYYDPETGRFINMDTITDGGAGVLGNNLFMYAANNPVNNSDSSGHWITKNSIKRIAKNVVNPMVKKVKNALSTKNATYSYGINLSVSPSVFIFNLQGGVSIDTNGNVAIQGSFTGGVTGGSPTASITRYQTVTNAPTIDKLKGPGYQVGGSFGVPVYGVPIAAGADLNIIPDTELNENYYGATTTVGFGTPGGEFHVEWGKTATWKRTQFNAFDVAKDIYVKIMEW